MTKTGLEIIEEGQKYHVFRDMMTKVKNILMFACKFSVSTRNLKKLKPNPHDGWTPTLWKYKKMRDKNDVWVIDDIYRDCCIHFSGLSYASSGEHFGESDKIKMFSFLEVHHIMNKYDKEFRVATLDRIKDSILNKAGEYWEVDTSTRTFLNDIVHKDFITSCSIHSPVGHFFSVSDTRNPIRNLDFETDIMRFFKKDLFSEENSPVMNAWCYLGFPDDMVPFATYRIIKSRYSGMYNLFVAVGSSAVTVETMLKPPFFSDMIRVYAGGSFFTRDGAEIGATVALGKFGFGKAIDSREVSTPVGSEAEDGRLKKPPSRILSHIVDDAFVYLMGFWIASLSRGENPGRNNVFTAYVCGLAIEVTVAEALSFGNRCTSCDPDPDFYVPVSIMDAFMYIKFSRQDSFFWVHAVEYNKISVIDAGSYDISIEVPVFCEEKLVIIPVFQEKEWSLLKIDTGKHHVSYFDPNASSGSDLLLKNITHYCANKTKTMWTFRQNECAKPNHRCASGLVIMSIADDLVCKSDDCCNSLIIDCKMLKFWSLIVFSLLFDMGLSPVPPVVLEDPGDVGGSNQDSNQDLSDALIVLGA